ncbi:MAG: carbon-nitrogen hydrolase family protein [Lachnospiraceae bacterium]|nr:carbon-nitrogen hydrolase family protein [Lachnospiraceae bacterium]
MAGFQIAVLQTKVSKEKWENLRRLEVLLEQPPLQRADLVTLPEMFTCPYDTACFPEYAEEEGGASWRFCSALAAKHRIYLAAGTMPERDRDGRIYNTAYVFDREGRQIAKYRKMHLFDIAVTGGQYFKESDTLDAGNEIVVFDTKFCRMGLCICYDFRFPELSRLLTDRGAEVLLVPAAFNMTTGPVHWENLFRQRAVDNQVFAVGIASARDTLGGYVSWGHSIITGPWGNVQMQMEEGEDIYIGEICLDEVKRVRAELPLLAHRRKDIYRLTEGSEEKE